MSRKEKLQFNVYVPITRTKILKNIKADSSKEAIDKALEKLQYNYDIDATNIEVYQIQTTKTEVKV